MSWCLVTSDSNIPDNETASLPRVRAILQGYLRKLQATRALFRCFVYFSNLSSDFSAITFNLQLPNLPPRECATAKMAAIRRAPYKDFLQPSLQRRFSSTTTILLVIAYIEAVIFAIVRSPQAVFSSWWSRKSPGKLTCGRGVLLTLTCSLSILRFVSHRPDRRTSLLPLPLRPHCHRPPYRPIPCRHTNRKLRLPRRLETWRHHPDP